MRIDKEKQLLEKIQKNAQIVYFFTHLFAPTCFGHHSIIIRVLDIKEYSKLQRMHPSKI